MRQSQLFTKTLRAVGAEETALNAQLLTRGGFVFKNSAGIYSYLPLGWRVITKISDIIREEMNAVAGVELFMPALVDRKYLETTDRFKLPVGFDAIGKNDKQAPYSLGWTHEEVLTAIASKYVSSYRDLPFAAYQIQTKFRNEARAKSGLLRGREFLMKDLYSFHENEKDLYAYYDRVKEAYVKVFERCDLHALYTLAAGGDFTASTTHEFQVMNEVGEDTIYYCDKCSYAENEEISKLTEGDACPQCDGTVLKANAIEVGNIFPLGTKYSEPFKLAYKDAEGNTKPVVMGSYGIGVSRLMATVVEVHHDDNGIVWPEALAPFRVHLLVLPGSAKAAQNADNLYETLLSAGVEVLYDERPDVSAGEKFADADLLGIPYRVTVSEKSLKAGGVELRKRAEKEARVLPADHLLDNV
jgi:prolyl-tRNA synthetase